MRTDHVTRAMFGTLILILGTGACARLGFRDRVLLRVLSPDRTLVAVCQEIPEFDGPGYAVRLERPDGTVRRRLYEVSDGDGCSEIAWAADGRTLAVLTKHVARARFVDVDWALRNPDVRTSHWSWRQVSFSGENEFIVGSGLRFIGPLNVELAVCPYNLSRVRQTGQVDCIEPPVVKRVSIPQPIVTGHPAS